MVSGDLAMASSLRFWLPVDQSSAGRAAESPCGSVVPLFDRKPFFAVVLSTFLAQRILLWIQCRSVGVIR